MSLFQGYKTLIPTKKGDREGFSHVEVGAQQVLGVVLTRELEVLSIIKGWRKKCPPFETGGGGGHEQFSLF